MTPLGNRIKELRLARGLSQAELAVRAGVTGGAVSQWENGVAKSLKGESLVRAAQALGVAPSDLLAATSRANELPNDEVALLRVFRALPADRKELATKLLKTLR